MEFEVVVGALVGNQGVWRNGLGVGVGWLKAVQD
jgi:hypothetical protein